MSSSPPLDEVVNQASSPALDCLLGEVQGALLKAQREDGHFVFELEADATIPAEYILLGHFIDDRDPALEAEIAAYLRAKQSARHGGWPLFYEGDLDISCSVKAYYALKLCGDDPDAPHMVRAREAILSHGGAEKANVFTRYALALFGQIPWSGVPTMPIELVLVPNWFFFTLWKVSYWSRTVIAPLLILAALKPRAKNPKNIQCQELFCVPPDRIKNWNAAPPHPWGHVFLKLDRVLKVLERWVFSKWPLRKKALAKTLDFIEERRNGLDGLGAIFPAMANLVMAYHTLSRPFDDPAYQEARGALKRLLVRVPSQTPDRAPMAYCQPCVSPVWDTALGLHALLESGIAPEDPRIRAGCDWLLERQILTKGDWSHQTPSLAPGGWAFQYRNDPYPDVDDTAVVGMLLHRVDRERYGVAIERALVWILGMQSTNGGFGAFDIDNDTDWLNAIPFADHGALLDPPTSDVTARCLSFLSQTQDLRAQGAIARGLAFLLDEQEDDGSWFGRWGTNYIYGTWSVLCALNAVGLDVDHPAVSRARKWLISQQRPDGGFGEDGGTYWAHRRGEVKASTPSQTAWALLGLMAAGAWDHGATQRGIAYLLSAERDPVGPRFCEEWFTAVGFPRVFYLKYHGYAAYFPLWALGRFKTFSRGDVSPLTWGM